MELLVSKFCFLEFRLLSSRVTVTINCLITDLQKVTGPHFSLSVLFGIRSVNWAPKIIHGKSLWKTCNILISVFHSVHALCHNGPLLELQLPILQSWLVDSSLYLSKFFRLRTPLVLASLPFRSLLHPLYLLIVLAR